MNYHPVSGVTLDPYDPVAGPLFEADLEIKNEAMDTFCFGEQSSESYDVVQFDDPCGESTATVDDGSASSGPVYCYSQLPVGKVVNVESVVTESGALKTILVLPKDAAGGRTVSYVRNGCAPVVAQVVNSQVKIQPKPVGAPSPPLVGML